MTVKEKLEISAPDIDDLALVMPVRNHIIAWKILGYPVARIRKFTSSVLAFFSVFNIFHIVSFGSFVKIVILLIGAKFDIMKNYSKIQIIKEFI